MSLMMLKIMSAIIICYLLLFDSRERVQKALK